MKVLLATDCYTFQTGGVTNVVLSLENGLRQNGCEVKVLALSNDRRSYRESESYYVRSRRLPDYPEHRISFAFRDPFLKELAAWKPDIVHIHTELSAGWMAESIAKKAGCPVVMTTHTDFEYFIFGRFRSFPLVRLLGRACGRLAYRHAERIIVPAEKARRFPHLLPYADRVVVIPNGLQLERYRKPVPPEEKSAMFCRCGLSDNGCTLVMVTRLSREKNIMEILRFLPALLRAVPEAQLVVVGEGPQRKQLESFTEKNGLAARVRFTGRIPPDEVYRYYDMGNVFVSASMFELHSMSYLEAMARGLPLVCREDPSLLGVLENGVNGFIYRNEQEYVEAVAKILGSGDLREQLRAGALRQADASGNRQFIRRSLDLYRSVCESWASGNAKTKKRKRSGK